MFNWFLRSTSSVPAPDQPAGDQVKRGMDMMEDGPSLLLFAGLLLLLSVLVVLIVPPLLRRLELRRAVPALALIGPVLGLAGGIIASGTMTLSGRDFWYALIVAVSISLAGTAVGWKLARPIASDLARIGATVESVGKGDRMVRTDIDRDDEIGRLANAVDDLSRSLARAEQERAVADEERNAVVSAVSHDLRTPLASLLVSVDAIEDNIGDSTAHLRTMRRNILALERLVEDLFLLARADSGRLALSLEPLDLSELIDEAVDVIRPVAGRRKIHVEATQCAPAVVHGDHNALGRVLRNLLDNAVRHSPPGGVVSVHLERRTTSVELTIVDQGKGFDPDFVRIALQRFTQADDSRSRPGASGLGLAIASTLVQAHGGRVDIQPGPGARVTVALPAVPSRRPALVGSY